MAAGSAPDFLEWLERGHVELQRAGLVRRPLVRRDDEHDILDLAGNDYLGLTRDARVVEAAVTATRRWGVGAGASRLVSGTTGEHVDLEETLAAFCGQPTGLVFSSGYLANLGAVTALAGRGDLVVCDAHAHASLMDASRLSRARVVTVDHSDVDAVADILRRRSERRALVVTESVFSVLGDAAPLVDLAAVCDHSGAVLLVDEAHGIGVAGRDGRGLTQASGLADLPWVVVTATLSKALGSQGGAVLGHPAVRRHLLNRARSFGYDTALAPAAAAGALAALTVVMAEPQRIANVLAVARRLAIAVGVCPSAGPAPSATATPPAGAVIAAACGGPAEAVAIAEACARQGVRVGCLRPPTVPDRVSRIRLTARATLSEDQLLTAERVLAATMASHGDPAQTTTEPGNPR